MHIKTSKNFTRKKKTNPEKLGTNKERKGVFYTILFVRCLTQNNDF